MPKKRSKATHRNSKILSYLAWCLFAIVLVLSSLIGGYYLGYDSAVEDIQDQNFKIQNKKTIYTDSKPILKKEQSVNSRLQYVLKKENKINQPKKVITKTTSHKYESLAKPPSRFKTEPIIISNKPKLAIIIDDVSTKSQVNAIKSLGLRVNISFFPPSKARPNSAILASKEIFYMVHLPMEARNYTAEEPLTMRIKHSQQEITKRVKELKKLFPNVKYINNHTGSKFTSNELAMNRLIIALDKYKINFIDSRTTAETKVPLVMKKFGKKYVARDIFLDNLQDKAYIKGQIQKAIKIAKKNGSAIAIGHPHANTIMALHESKELLKEVELVYVNKLY